MPINMAAMDWLLPTYVFIFGLLLGSFLGLCAVRIPAGESVVAPRSHCRRCSRTLPWYENIPILSYLILKGRCRGCGEKISLSYPLIELVTAGLTLFSYFQITPWPRFLVWLLLFVLPVLLLMLTDWEQLLLPDAITLPGIGAGFVVHWLDGMFLAPIALGVSTRGLILDSLLGALLGGMTLALLGLAYQRLRGRVGMGGGDVKMAAMLGAFFGWKAIFFIFFLASLLGLLLGLAWMLLKRADKQVAVPFGTCMGLAALLFLYRGEWLLEHYLGLFRKLL